MKKTLHCSLIALFASLLFTSQANAVPLGYYNVHHEAGWQWSYLFEAGASLEQSTYQDNYETEFFYSNQTNQVEKYGGYIGFGFNLFDDYDLMLRVTGIDGSVGQDIEFTFSANAYFYLEEDVDFSLGGFFGKGTESVDYNVRENARVTQYNSNLQYTTFGPKIGLRLKVQEDINILAHVKWQYRDADKTYAEDHSALGIEAGLRFSF